MADLKVTARVLECPKIKDRMEQLLQRAAEECVEYGIFVTPETTDEQAEDGGFFVCECDNPPLGAIEIWNTADGELI